MSSIEAKQAARVLGERGEQAVQAWYSHHGFDITATNWTCREGELDIVATKGSMVVFCEVKSRVHERFAAAAEAVDWRKQQKIRTAALHWLRSQSGRYYVRFDVAVVISGRVQVIEDAF